MAAIAWRMLDWLEQATAARSPRRVPARMDEELAKQLRTVSVSKSTEPRFQAETRLETRRSGVHMESAVETGRVRNSNEPEV